MPSRLAYEVGVDGIGTAVAGLRTLKGAQDSVAGGNSDLGRTAGEMAQRVQGAAANVANLAGRLGSPGVASGANLIGSLAGSVAQMAALGASMGPAGLVLGATGLLTTAIGALAAMHHTAAEASRIERTELDALASAAIAARNAASVDADVASGGGTDGQRQQAAERARQQAAEAQGIVEGFERDIARIDALSEQSGPLGSLGSALFGDLAGDGLREEAVERLEQYQATVRTSLAEVARIEGEDLQRSESARLTSEDAANAAILVARRLAVEELARTEAAAAEAAASAAAEAAREAEARRAAAISAARAAADAREASRIQAIRDASEVAGEIEDQRVAVRQREIDVTTALAAKEQERFTAAEAQSQAEIAWSRTLLEGEEAELAAMGRKSDAYHALALAADDASLAFGTGYVNSIDQVIESYRELQRTGRTVGRDIGVSSRLMERSLVAVGNNIAETVGGTMVGAFQEALGAWLDGSLSFVEAAERMAKGVIKSLVTESIVQAIVEGARAIASLASQDYVGAASHAAAAAAWAAVGVVAGGVGAGIGAFGGGGGAEGGASRVGADASREREREREPIVSYNIVVNPGGFVTSRDVERGLVDGLNRADRAGLRPGWAGR